MSKNLVPGKYVRIYHEFGDAPLTLIQQVFHNMLVVYDYGSTSKDAIIWPSNLSESDGVYSYQVLGHDSRIMRLEDCEGNRICLSTFL